MKNSCEKCKYIIHDKKSHSVHSYLLSISGYYRKDYDHGLNQFSGECTGCHGVAQILSVMYLLAFLRMLKVTIDQHGEDRYTIVKAIADKQVGDEE